MEACRRAYQYHTYAPAGWLGHRDTLHRQDKNQGHSIVRGKKKNEIELMHPSFFVAPDVFSTQSHSSRSFSRSQGHPSEGSNRILFTNDLFIVPPFAICCMLFCISAFSLSKTAGNKRQEHCAVRHPRGRRPTFGKQYNEYLYPIFRSRS